MGSELLKLIHQNQSWIYLFKRSEYRKERVAPTYEQRGVVLVDGRAHGGEDADGESLKRRHAGPVAHEEGVDHEAEGH